VVEPLIKTDTPALPEPDDEAKKRSRLLLQCIKKECDRAGGQIRFSEFMNIALYQPGLGYYSGGLQKFGEQGDFITAPEVSPLFGQCIAGQIAEVFQNIRQTSDEKLFVIEFGAGSGVLAVDVLLQLEQLNELPEKYLILELSAELQQRQQETVKHKAPHLYERVQWLQQLPDDVANAVVIANEVLDAMPVECFRINNDEKIEILMLAVEDEKLLASYVADDSLGDRLNVIRQRSEIELADGYRSELNPAIAGWLAALENN
jgi:SAM-dependent MidA family methyltransferase